MKIVVPPKHEHLADPDRIRLEQDQRKRILVIAEESGHGFSACVRYLVGAGLDAYEKAQGDK